METNTTQGAGASTDSGTQAVKDTAPPVPATAQVASLAQKDSPPATPVAVAIQAVDPDVAELDRDKKRIAVLGQLGKELRVSEAVIGDAIAADDDYKQARKRFLAHLQKTAKPESNMSNGTVSVGEDRQFAMLAVAMPQALVLGAIPDARFYATDDRRRLVRDGSGKAKVVETHEMAQKLRGLSAAGMFQRHLIALGAPMQEVYEMSRVQLWDLMNKNRLRHRFPRVAELAQSTSDFDNVLLDAMNVSMMRAFVESPRTWDLWAARATTPDFRTIYRTQLSAFPPLVERKEGGKIDYATLSDSKETAAVKEYIGGIRFTRKAFVNDTNDAFGTVPAKEGAAATRLEEDVAYAMITANAAMADGGALFNSTAASDGGSGHANLVTGSSNIGSVTVTTMSATEKLMLLQKDPKCVADLGLEPAFWLGPTSLKTVAEQFFGSTVDPAKNNSTNNPYAGRLKVVSSSRLNTNSTTKWHLMADYRRGIIETFAMYFLTDEPEPTLKQQTDFETDDILFAVRHCVVGLPLDWRSVVQNPGA